MCFNPLELLLTVLIIFLFGCVYISDLLNMVSERRRIKRINKNESKRNHYHKNK